MTDRELADLQAENARLRAAHATSLIAGATGGDHTTLYVTAVVVTSMIAVVAIVSIFIVRPDRDNTALIAIVVGFLLPIVSGLLGAAVREVKAAVNGRLTQLLALTAKASRAQGQLDEQAKSAVAVVVDATRQG